MHLAGIVDLLSSALYSHPRVYLRELLQNAVDAIRARSRRDPTFATAGIRLVAAGNQSDRVRVIDDGTGLTPEEITEFLATVGQSSKRDEFGLPDASIGRFGIGLLSALMVADEVRVRTRSMSGGPAHEWIGRVDGTFALNPIPDDLPIGTEVSFVPRRGMEDLTSHRALADIADRYAAYLPILIRLDDASGAGSETITREPGFLSDNPAERLRFGEELLGTSPLAMIHIDVPLTGTKGTAYVLPQPPAPHDGPANIVYGRRMLIDDRASDLAPNWAFFARIVVDSTGLNPTASREHLADDEPLRVTRDAIADALRGWMQEMHDEEPVAFAGFVATHYLGLKAAVLFDDDVAPLVVRYLPFETNRGMRTVGELAADGREFGWVGTTDRFRQLVALSGPTATIINASYTWDRDLLARIPDLIPGTVVRELSVSAVLERLEAVPASDATLADAFAQRATKALATDDVDCEVRLAANSATPAFLLTDPSLLRRTERDAAKRSSEGWADVLGTLDALTSAQSSRAGMTVLFNWANPLVRQLAQTDDAISFARSVRLLHLQAILATGRPLTTAESDRLTETLSDLMLLGLNRETP